MFWDTPQAAGTPQGSSPATLPTQENIQAPTTVLLQDLQLRLVNAPTQEKSESSYRGENKSDDGNQMNSTIALNNKITRKKDDVDFGMTGTRIRKKGPVLLFMESKYQSLPTTPMDFQESYLDQEQKQQTYDQSFPLPTPAVISCPPDVMTVVSGLSETTRLMEAKRSQESNSSSNSAVKRRTRPVGEKLARGKTSMGKRTSPLLVHQVPSSGEDSTYKGSQRYEGSIYSQRDINLEPVYVCSQLDKKRGFSLSTIGLTDRSRYEPRNTPITNKEKVPKADRPSGNDNDSNSKNGESSSYQKVTYSSSTKSTMDCVKQSDLDQCQAMPESKNSSQKQFKPVNWFRNRREPPHVTKISQSPVHSASDKSSRKRQAIPNVPENMEPSLTTKDSSVEQLVPTETNITAGKFEGSLESTSNIENQFSTEEINSNQGTAVPRSEMEKSRTSSDLLFQCPSFQPDRTTATNIPPAQHGEGCGNDMLNPANGANSQQVDSDLPLSPSFCAESIIVSAADILSGDLVEEDQNPMTNEKLYSATHTEADSEVELLYEENGRSNSVVILEEKKPYSAPSSSASVEETLCQRLLPIRQVRETYDTQCGERVHRLDPTVDMKANDMKTSEQQKGEVSAQDTSTDPVDKGIFPATNNVRMLGPGSEIYKRILQEYRFIGLQSSGKNKNAADARRGNGPICVDDVSLDTTTADSKQYSEAGQTQGTSMASSLSGYSLFTYGSEISEPYMTSSFSFSQFTAFTDDDSVHYETELATPVEELYHQGLLSIVPPCCGGGEPATSSSQPNSFEAFLDRFGWFE